MDKETKKLMITSGIVAGLLIIVLLLAVASSILLPSKSIEITQNDSPKNIVIEPDATTNTLLNFSEEKCDEYLLEGGHKDNYTYRAKIGGNSVLMDSSYIGKEGTTNIREVTTSVEGGPTEISGVDIGSMIVRVVMDEEFNCLNVELKGQFTGEGIAQGVQCFEGIESGIRVCKKDVELVGKDDVTVPYGTFSADLYRSVDNSTEIWISKEIATPLKLKSVEMEMELIDFQKME